MLERDGDVNESPCSVKVPMSFNLTSTLGLQPKLPVTTKYIYETQKIFYYKKLDGSVMFIFQKNGSQTRLCSAQRGNAFGVSYLQFTDAICCKLTTQRATCDLLRV